MDTNPLSAEPELIVDQHKELFVTGLAAIRHLTSGRTLFVRETIRGCRAENIPNVQFEEFAGVHPGRAGRNAHPLSGSGWSQQDGVDHRLSGRHRDWSSVFDWEKS